MTSNERLPFVGGVLRGVDDGEKAVLPQVAARLLKVLSRELDRVQEMATMKVSVKG